MYFIFIRDIIQGTLLYKYMIPTKLAILFFSVQLNVCTC